MSGEWGGAARKLAAAPLGMTSWAGWTRGALMQLGKHLPRRQRAPEGGRECTLQASLNVCTAPEPLGCVGASSIIQPAIGSC